MIATWMVAATLFTLFLGVAAVAIERALRALGRQARGPWLAAFAAALAWPVIAPMVAALFPAPARGGAPTVLPAVRSTIGTITSTLPALPTSWISRVDAALVPLWVIASVLLIVRLVVAWRALSSVERAASPVVIAGVPVLVTPSLGPAVFGVRRPRLLVPQWLLDLDAPLRALVVRHEQEHCRVRDAQLTLAVAIGVALVPWNAGAWWIARRLRLAMELDCDARVLRGATNAERYGRLLLFIAQRQSRTHVATMLAESNSDLSLRITAMNTPRPANPTTLVALLALVAAGAIACSTKYAADLTTSPSEGRSLSSSAQETGATYYEPKGAKAAKLAKPATPRYPASLRSTKVEGEVLVAFVVDTSGLAIPSSLKVLRSTDSLFTAAVRDAIVDMRFVPAQFNGRKVKQLVQQPFFFDVRGSAASAARKPAPAARPSSDPAVKNPMTLRPIVVAVP
jgi:TonB family protein